MWRIKAASGAARAKAKRTREAISTTRAPSFKSRRRMVLNSAVARACALGIASRNSEHEPVGRGVQDQPHLIGERAAAAGAIGGKLGLVQFYQILGLASGAVERLVDMLGRPGLDAGDAEADIEALCVGLDPGTRTPVDM